MKKSKKKLKKYMKTNENENTIYQYVCDAAKAILRGKCIAIHANLKEKEKSQINNLILYLKKL